LNLNKKYPIYLKSKNEKIRLLVKEIYVGDFNLTQVVVIAEKELTSGDIYEMVIENLADYQQNEYKRYDSAIRSFVAPIWKTESRQDNLKPTWISKPREQNKIFESYGCGPEMFVSFSLSILEAPERIVRAKMKDIESGKTTTFYVEIENSTISIGHGMCSGGFKFGKSSLYEIEFDLVDSSGNVCSWEESPIVFEKPTFENRRKK